MAELTESPRGAVRSAPAPTSPSPRMVADTRIAGAWRCRIARRSMAVQSPWMEEEPEMAECPVCGGDVPLEKDIVVGELMECPDCGSELEVLTVKPPTLGEAPETEEDWGE